VIEDFQVKNAIIKSSSFDTERGLSAWLQLDYGGTCQGFGGYLLYAPKGWAAHNNPVPCCGHFVYRCFQIAEVDDWSKLPGRTIRALTSWGKCKAIGHIVKEDWFDPSEEFEELRRMVSGGQE
jgi:hypothetical protein